MISILVPTLNEAKNIPRLINHLIKLNFQYELIIIDDNSTDNTDEVIKKFISKKIKFLKRKNKTRDLSKSILYGAEKAKYNYILVLDCDLQHDISNSNLMKKKLLDGNMDVVIGSRFLKKKYSGNLGILRSLFSIIFIFFINTILHKKSSDPLSGFFICKKQLLVKYKKNFYLKGYKILFDIIYNGKKNIILEDIQIKFKKRLYGKSKLNFKIVKIFINQFIYTFFQTFLKKKKT